MDSITVPARLDSLEEIRGFVGRRLEALGCASLTLLQIRLAIEEIFVNITSYAYHPGDGDADTKLDTLLGREGGLGILLVRETMDEVLYSYENGKNVLTMLKKL